MKVLWFNVTEPTRYQENNGFIGGWQDSLESIVSPCKLNATSEIAKNKKILSL